MGSKPPLRIKNVWSIRNKLQVDGRLKDLAMLNLAIDSKLRGCDVITPRGSKTASRLMEQPLIAPRCANGKPDIP